MQPLKREIIRIPPAFDRKLPFNSVWSLCSHDERPDDEMLILERINVHIYKGWLLYIPLIISFIFAVVISWIPVKIASFILFAFILYRCIYGFKVETSDQLIFNRKEGNVTYPLYNEGRIIKQTELFIKAPFTIAEESFPEPKILYLGYTNDKEKNIPVCSFDVLDAWSFLVWYMDRNRPLPLGTIFDAYREKDYNRRKSNGFPAPLFPSRIDIPDLD